MNTNWTEGLILPQLAPGSHDDPSEGLCAMEMVAYIERLPHSDSPPCTCPIIATYVRRGNDFMSDEERQRLWPYLPRLVGTVAPELEQQRAVALAMNAVRQIAPISLESIGARRHADACRRATDLKSAAAARAAAAAAAAADAATARATATAAAAAAAAAAARAAAADATAAYTAARAAAAAYIAVVASCAVVSATRDAVIKAWFRGLDDALAIGRPGAFTVADAQVRVKSAALEGPAEQGR